MQEDVHDMPSGRLQTEEAVVQRQPADKERPPIIAARLARARSKGPDIRGKGLPDIAAGFDQRVLDDLKLIVVNEGAVRRIAVRQRRQ